MTQGIVRRPQPVSRAIAAALVALAVSLTLAACDSGDSGKPKSIPESPPARAVETPPARSFLEQLIPPKGGVLPSARISDRIRRLVARLPLERKVAQLLLVGFEGRDPSAPFFRTLARMDLGGVVIQRRNYTGAASVTALTDAVANAVAGGSHEPPFVVAPQEGGEFSAFPDLPPRLAPGEIDNAGDAAAEAARAARTLKRLGLNGVLAPDADVGASDPDALGTRAYSDNPAEVSRYAVAVVVAYRRARMLSAPSHFPGIGAASQATDEGPTAVGLGMRELERRDVRPFRAAIRAGAPAILVGHAAYAPDSFVLPASLSRAIETNLLRGGVGFRGIAITDDLQSGAIVAGNTVARAAVQAVQAGADMVWISAPEPDWSSAYAALVAAVKSRAIPLTRLNAAVTRIVTVKRELGLRIRRRPAPAPTAPATPTAPVAPGTPSPG